MTEQIHWDTVMRSKRVDVRWDPVTKKHSVTIVGTHVGRQAAEFTLDLGAFLEAHVQVGESRSEIHNAAGEVATSWTDEMFAEIRIRGQLIPKADGTLHYMQIVDSPYGSGFDECGNVRENQ